MKLALICTYFGKLPAHFPLWLETCRYNESVDFILITDDQSKYKVPENVKMIHWTFDRFEKRLQEKFDFPINIRETPYKICDFRPLYGYVFSDILGEYDYWGQCELDMLFGNIGKFLTDNVLNKYDKLLCLGHLTVYRNSPDVDKFLEKPYPCGITYYDLLQKPYLCNADEQFHKYSINTLYKEYNIPIYTDGNKYIADILPAFYNFRLCRLDSYNNRKIEKRLKQIFVWDKGTLSRTYLKKDQLIQEEFLYLHFQKRAMKVLIRDKTLRAEAKFAIVPNAFLRCDFEVNKENIKKYSKLRIFYPRYFKLKKKSIKAHIEIIKRRLRKEE